eukprot:gb/GECG01001975.1/.p1 GENE.gb/GECG01001975.1/~~gb/GECG01001975.1/.p1  ORF type:complete len:672 (+),score=57.77 gb/GECG01001975.1/:1-2016(+)
MGTEQPGLPVEIQYEESPEDGASSRQRRLIAKGVGIAPGMTIFRSDPVAVAITSATSASSAGLGAGEVACQKDEPGGATQSTKAARSACWGCLRTCAPGGGPLRRCAGCKSSSYCSRSCQVGDWKAFHQLECSGIKKIQGDVGREVVPSAITRMLLRTLMFLRQTTENEELDEVDELQYLPLGHNSRTLPTGGSAFRSESPVLAEPSSKWVWSCVSNRDRFSTSQLQNLGDIMTKVHHLSLQRSTSEGNGEASLVSRFGVKDCINLLCAMSCNIYTICTPELDVVGIGFYPFTATLNHSCVPNCAVIYNGKHQALRSVECIPAGGELTLSYCDNTLPSSLVRWHLLQGYKFWCKCRRCLEVDNHLYDVLIGKECDNHIVASSFEESYREFYLVGLRCSQAPRCDGIAIPDVTAEAALSCLQPTEEELQEEPTFHHQPLKQVREQLESNTVTPLAVGFLMTQFVSSLEDLVNHVSTHEGGSPTPDQQSLGRVMNITWRCCCCGELVEKSALKKLLRHYKSSKEYMKSLQSMEQAFGRKEELISGLEQCFMALSTFCSPWHFLLLQTSEVLAREYIDYKNYEKALYFAKEAAQRTAMVVPGTSLKCCIHFLMVAKLQWYLNYAHEALLTLETSVFPQLNVLYGKPADSNVALAREVSELHLQIQAHVARASSG